MYMKNNVNVFCFLKCILTFNLVYVLKSSKFSNGIIMFFKLNVLYLESSSSELFFLSCDVI